MSVNVFMDVFYVYMNSAKRQDIYWNERYMDCDQWLQKQCSRNTRYLQTMLKDYKT